MNKLLFFSVPIRQHQNKKIETPNKAYVDSLSENNSNRRDLSTVYNDEDDDLDNFEITTLESSTVSRNSK